MAYVDVYDYDYGKITLDIDTIQKIVNASKKRLSEKEGEQETFEELLDKLEDIEIDDVDVYLRTVNVSTDDIEEAYEDYCGDSDDYESGKEDGYEEGYNVGLNASEKLGQEFRRINWKILSKLEKYAYYNEKVDFSKDDAKEILDLINSI